MLELSGTNLPKRQQEINKLVQETVRKKVNFDEIKILEEKSDVDRLFKIDVASKYKEINYILDTFKSGDSLYISRALKCLWIYNDEYSSFINPEYLHENIFPLMSVKMKVKMLNAISVNVRNEERALSFYKYCVANKLESLAFKFLIFTSDAHKLEFLKDPNNNNHSINIKEFVGNSFPLAEAYLQSCHMYKRNNVIYQLRYLYFISNEKYLDLLETQDIHNSYLNRNEVLGLRISKDILTKHKQRVLKNPKFYLKHLHIKMIVKHSSIADAKLYLPSLLPLHVNKFWNSNFCEVNKEVINIIPQDEIFHYLKQVFEAKYPNEPFEMSKEFYNNKLYRLFTAEQREAWALENLKQNKELLGQDKDFLWYRFVNFDLAFKEIKRYIYITSNHSNRAEMLDILIESAKNEIELEKAINYFYDRHINERSVNKVDFMDKIYDVHNVFKFNDATWNSYNKILHSMNVYTEDFYLDQFRTISMVYHIIHNKEVPKTLQSEVISYTRIHYVTGHFQKLTENEIEQVFKFYVNLCINNMKELDVKEYNEENKYKIADVISSTITVLEMFEKNKDDIPDIIMKYIKQDWKSYENHKFINNGNEKKETTTESTLIRLLKEDATLLLNKLPEFLESANFSYKCRLTRLMKKLKIYFANDVATNVLNILEELLSKKDDKYYTSNSCTIICSILQIANEDYKINLITKYAPVAPKIAHDTIDRHLLRIQESICRCVQYSRPPVPLQVVQKYIKGDYVAFCLPMFGAYAANLPRPLTLQFVAAILDAPVSVQKHGLRLAFKCFDVEGLKKLILDVWKKTKNVSLRMIIYTALFNYLETNALSDVYEVLKILTLDLHEDDQDEIFSLLQSTSKVPTQFRSDFIESSWKAVAKLPQKNSKSLCRQKAVIDNMVANIEIIDKDFCRVQILDEFVDFMLFKKNIRPKYSSNEIESLINGKWILASNYITHFDSIDQFNKSWELVSTIIKKCVEMWDDVHEKSTFTTRRFLKSFLKNTLLLTYWDVDKTRAIPLLQNIIKQLEDLLPVRQIYLLYCEFHLLITLKTSWFDAKFKKEDLNFDVLSADIGEKVVAFLLDLKQKKLLYPSLYPELAEMVHGVIEKMTYSTELISRGELTPHVCDRMTDVQVYETFLMALLILPPKVKDDINYKSAWTSVINKAKQFDDEEILTLVCHKFGE